MFNCQLSKSVDVWKEQLNFPLLSTGPGICQSIQQETVKFIEETEQLIRASNTSHFPFGESFLMAKGMQLMDSDLLRSTRPYESEMMISEKLLSGSDYALQLAAQSGGGRGR